MPNKWSLTQTVAPTVEPITPADMSDHARISISVDDVWMLAAIKASRSLAETILNRQIMTATYRLTLDFFPSWELKLPLPPLQSVTSITYVDSAGTTQTLSASLYQVSTDSQPGRITPAYSQVWPISRVQMDGVKVTFVAGYTSAANVPDTIKLGIKMLASYYYEHREYSDEQVTHENTLAVALLEGERVLDFSGPLGSSNNVPSAVSAWGGNQWRN